MRLAKTYVLEFFSLLLAFLVFAQQPSTSATQSRPQVLVQKSLAVRAGSQPVTDVMLTGTACRVAGSDRQSGIVIIKVLAETGVRIEEPCHKDSLASNTDGIRDVV